MSRASTETAANEFWSGVGQAVALPALTFLETVRAASLFRKVKVCYPSTEVVRMDWQKVLIDRRASCFSDSICAQLFSFCEERLFCEERHHISPTDLGLSLQQRARWSVRNVGNGPALDVLIARRTDDQSDWTYPVRIAPVSKDGSP